MPKIIEIGKFQGIKSFDEKRLKETWKFLKVWKDILLIISSAEKLKKSLERKFESI